MGRFSTLKLLVSIYLLLWVNCYCSIKLFPIKFSQEGIKSGCALFLFIPSVSNYEMLPIKVDIDAEKIRKIIEKIKLSRNGEPSKNH